jgi:hypothetical protein
VSYSGVRFVKLEVNVTPRGSDLMKKVSMAYVVLGMILI